MHADGANGDSPNRAQNDHHQDHANICTSKGIFQCFSFFVVCHSGFAMDIISFTVNRYSL
jgi:hypothetical protein